MIESLWREEDRPVATLAALPPASIETERATQRLEIEARWAATSQGPWIRTGSQVIAPLVPASRALTAHGASGNWAYRSYCGELVAESIQRNDAIAIAAAPGDVAFLLSEVRRLEKELAMARHFDSRD